MRRPVTNVPATIAGLGIAARGGLSGRVVAVAVGSADVAEGKVVDWVGDSTATVAVGTGVAVSATVGGTMVAGAAVGGT